MSMYDKQRRTKSAKKSKHCSALDHVERQHLLSLVSRKFQRLDVKIVIPSGWGPVAVVINNTKWKVKSWKELIICVYEYLESVNPEHLHDCIEDFPFCSDNHRCLSFDIERARSEYCLSPYRHKSGVYINTGSNSIEYLDSIRVMCRACKVPLDHVELKLKKKMYVHSKRLRMFGPDPVMLDLQKEICKLWVMSKNSKKNGVSKRRIHRLKDE